jgi:hypothetical protein
MTTKHTPGPWHYAECQMGAPFIDTEAIGDLFASVLPLDEERANVRLMAAAPDLLEACEAVAATTWSKNTATIIGERVRAAIAKAKGEMP